MSAPEVKNRNGRRPIAERQAAAEITDIDFGNNLRLAPEIIKEIKDKGLAHRFVDSKQLEKYGNTHKNGWVPYKAAARADSDVQTMQLGIAPDGFVRRGTLVLAVRSKQIDDQHRHMINKRNFIAKNAQQQAAGKLREMARSAGLKEDIVSEGFDEDGD